MTALISRRRRLGALSVLAVTSLVLSACGSSDDSSEDKAAGFSINVDDCEDPDGATAAIEDSILVGYSAPLSGPVAGPVELARAGYDARIKAANEAGGIDGLKIEVKYRDDAYQPDKAKSNATEFIQKDKVDVMTTFGAGPLGGFIDDQNAACVPTIYPSSSDPQFLDLEAYPWTAQFLPSSDAETKFLVTYVKEKVPNAKIGIVENATASGKAMGEAFKENAEKAGLEVVEVVEDTDPNAAATSIKASGANVVYHAGVVGSCGVFDTARERVDYQPELVVKASNCVNAPEYIAAGKAADGVVIAKYLKDTADPAYADDEGVKTYTSQLDKGADPANTVTQAGWTQADLLVKTLEQAAASKDGLTRKSIIEAARAMDYASPLLLDGIKWVSTPERPAGVDAFEPYAWDVSKKTFVSAGDVIKVD